MLFIVKYIFHFMYLLLNKKRKTFDVMSFIKHISKLLNEKYYYYVNQTCIAYFFSALHYFLSCKVFILGL